MSQAFVRESDDQWLDEVSPTVKALIMFLTRENNGIRVYEQKNYKTTLILTSFRPPLLYP